MSLKTFHVLFICVAVLLCWGFAYWCIAADAAAGNACYGAGGPVAFLCGLGLILYGFKFLQRMRSMNIR